MSEQRDEYASQMPLEIRLAVDGLSGHNDTGYAVVMLLSEESQLRFEELREELNVHRQTLTNTLDDLQHGGLVKKRAGELIGDQSTGAYELSDFGDRLLNGLYQGSQPARQLELAATPEQYRNTTADELLEDSRNVWGHKQPVEIDQNNNQSENNSKQKKLNTEANIERSNLETKSSPIDKTPNDKYTDNMPPIVRGDS